MMLCLVYYDHIITAKEVHLRPQLTVLIFNAYDDCTAGMMFSVGSSLTVHTSQRTEESGRCVCVCVEGSGRLVQREEVL